MCADLIDTSNNPLHGKDRIKVLFVRPPGRMWPIINESDNFLLPLGFPCLAAYLRERGIGYQAKILDCFPIKMGWETLKKTFEEERPDVLGIGDMVVYMPDGIKAAALMKEIKPDTLVVAGGHFHSHMPQHSFEHYPQIDVIVRWEGEVAFLKLLEALRNGGNLHEVGSLAFRENGNIVQTKPEPLIEPLDELPVPAYDLVPIDLYSPFGKLWPRAITVQLGRGCSYNCNFCSWSAQEGEHVMHEGGDIELIPRYRHKSVERMLDELDMLYNSFGVRYLFWVDGTWNLKHELMAELSEGIIKRGYKLGWWAFVRPDLLVEQEKLGILDKMVKAGLRHVLLGGERPEDSELAQIGKTEAKGSYLYEACKVLRGKYPQVFRQSTFITGIRSETPESMKRLGVFSRKVNLDFAAFHPFMPYPGTPIWHEAVKNDWIEEMDFSKFDMFYPVMPSETMTREEIAKWTEKLYMDFIGKRPWRYLLRLFSPHAIRRRLHWWFLYSNLRVILVDLWNSIRGVSSFKGFAATSALWEPKWYNS